MSTPKQVSDYMRKMQRRSSESRWSGLSAAERSAKMKAVRAAAAKKKRTKTKARALRQNDALCRAAVGNDGAQEKESK